MSLLSSTSSVTSRQDVLHLLSVGCVIAAYMKHSVLLREEDVQEAAAEQTKRDEATSQEVEEAKE